MAPLASSDVLPPGSMFGSLEIVALLGAGGMGQVYQARDPRLGRTVALKILPKTVANDPDRLLRFDREARTLAALNHPNIAQIYGVEQSGDARALVMELAEGEDLSQIIARGPIPTNEALAIARQIADALDAAHEQGIVHRDLKPANIRVRGDNRVKVLDFGLAKAIDPAHVLEDSIATLTSPAVTAHGVILGTAAYMAPEQARGRPVDKRADIWAFGVVLYEMLTGARLFAGDSVADTIAQVVSRDPDMARLPADLAPAIRLVLRRCLQREPRERLRDAADARVLLDPVEPADERARMAAVPPRSYWRWGAATVAILAAATAGWAFGVRQTPPAPGFESFSQLTTETGEETTPALSPDGTSVAYAREVNGSWDIFVQRVGGRNAIAVAADPARHESGPAFSPDGLWLAFHESDRDGGIFIVGATGESARRLTDFGFDPSWTSDGKQIVFATEEALDPYTRHAVSSLWRVQVGSDSPPVQITQGDAIQPSISPSGRRVAFWANTGGQRDIFTMAADGSDRQPVSQDAAVDWSPVWAPDGQNLYYASDRGGSMNIWRVPIDEASGRLLGSAQSITKGVYASADRPSLSRDGSRIVFRSQIRTVNPVAAPLDPDAERLGPIRTLIRATDVLTPTSVSPDGQWLILSSQTGRRDEIYICRADGSGLRQLTDDNYRDRWPRWSRDGKDVFFYSNRGGRFEIWSIRIDGSGLRRVAGQPGIDIHFPVLAPSGDRLIASTQTSPDSWIVDLTKPWDPKTAPKLEGLGTADEWLIPVDWSPDGRKLVGPMMSRAGTINALGVYEFTSGSSGRLIVRSPLGDTYRYIWLPDSRRIVVVDRSNRIHLFDTVTQRHRTLLENSPWRFWGNIPPIAPDGRTIYLGSLDVQSDVWMVTK